MLFLIIPPTTPDASNSTISTNFCVEMQTFIAQEFLCLDSSCRKKSGLGSTSNPDHPYFNSNRSVFENTSPSAAPASKNVPDLFNLPFYSI